MLNQKHHAAKEYGEKQWVGGKAEEPKVREKGEWLRAQEKDQEFFHAKRLVFLAKTVEREQLITRA